jgi:D-glycero-D-manno-heptose 1,7-bisphosphate phosphatase
VTSERFPAVFLDRDGTLMEEVDYCREPEKVRLLPGVPEGLAKLKAAGFPCVIITNQSGIGRGRIKMAEYEAVHARLLELLGSGLIAATYFCPDAPGTSCECRKPAPGMVLAAAEDLKLDLSHSWMVGDKASDIGCGRNAGTRTILVQTGYGKKEGDTGADFVAPDFAAAVEMILKSRMEGTV